MIFFFNDTATTEIYTLSLHDALPIFLPATVLTGGRGGGFDARVTAGSLADLHGDAIALGERRAKSAHASVGERVAIRLGDGTRTRATVVAVYERELGFGDALLAPELAAGHLTSPLLGTILV